MCLTHVESHGRQAPPQDQNDTHNSNCCSFLWNHSGQKGKGMWAQVDQHGAG